MTKVGRLFEEEKIEALRKLEEEKNQEIKKLKKEMRREVKKQTILQSSKTIARRMLEDGMPIAEIQKFITNLSYEEIAALNKN